MESRPCVAVLMAACNGLPWIEQQIDSILQQQGVRLELFISVDPSSDDTRSYCHARQAADPRVHLLPGEGPGSASGNFLRLLGEVPLGGFDYVALADQDDIWLEDKLARGILCLQKEGADGYSSSFTAFWDDGQPERYVDKSAPQTEYDYLFESPGPGCSFILTPRLVDSFRQHLKGVSAEKLHQLQFHDWLIYAFARYRGFDWFIDSESRLRYRQHGKNVIGVNHGLKAVVARLQAVFSGQWQNQAVLTADLIGMEQHPFVRKWRQLSAMSYGFLMLNTRKIRRNKSDRNVLIFLFFILIFLSLFNKFKRIFHEK